MYDLLGVQTHRNDSSSERTEGVEAIGTDRWPKVSPQDSGQKKKRGEEGKIRKQKVAVMQLNHKKPPQKNE